jgi:hypothetical protein
VCKCDHVHSFGTTGDRIVVELVLSTFPERDRQRIPESHRIT